MVEVTESNSDELLTQDPYHCRETQRGHDNHRSPTKDWKLSLNSHTLLLPHTFQVEVNTKTY